jgi:hypothetical protein
VERFGLFAAVYPVNLGPVHLGVFADAMWHYDIDFGRSPSTVGYVNIGLAPTATVYLTSSFFTHATFGLNWMGYRNGSSTDYTLGTLAEASAGFLLGSAGTGLTLEAVFQNRTGSDTIRYGLFRVGFQF